MANGIEIQTGLAALFVGVGLAVWSYLTPSSSSKDQLKTVPGLPLIGVALELAPDKISNFFSACCKKFGKVYQFYAFGTRYIVISDASLMREILQKRPKTFRRSTKFGEVFKTTRTGEGLFGAEGQQWSKLRRHNSPSFSKQNVELMLGTIFDEASQLMERFKDKISANKAVDSLATVAFDSELFALFTQILIRLSLGNATGEAKAYLNSPQFYSDLQQTFFYVSERLLFPFPRFVWKLTPMFKLETAAIANSATLTKHTEAIIQQAREASLFSDNNEDDGSLISRLIRGSSEEKGLTNSEVSAAVITFLFAGTETTKATFTWVPYFLSLHPDVLSLLREEVDAFFLVNDGKVKENLSKLIQLPYSTAVAKEILRLVSPAAFLFLEATEPTSTKLSNGLEIFPHDQVTVDFESCALDEYVFPSSKTFLPSRWLTDDSKQLELMNASFLVFGGGARVCPGMHLSIAEFIVCTALFVHTFDFSLACPKEEIKRIFAFTSRANKMPINIELRKCV